MRPDQRIGNGGDAIDLGVDQFAGQPKESLSFQRAAIREVVRGVVAGESPGGLQSIHAVEITRARYWTDPPKAEPGNL